MLVQTGGRWVGILRTGSSIPGALGRATASLLFWGLYSGAIRPLNPFMDGINSLGKSMGLVTQTSQVSFLGSPNTALLSTTALDRLEYSGFYMIILPVGLQGIPRDAYEAAAIDGAGRWQVFRSITLPLPAPVAGPGADPVHHRIASRLRSVLHPDEGRPDNTTVTLVQLIYREAFTRHNLGTAAAVSIIVLAGLLVFLNALQFRGLSRSAAD